MREAFEHNVVKAVRDAYPGAEAEVGSVDRIGGSYRGLTVKLPGAGYGPCVNLDVYDEDEEGVIDKILDAVKSGFGGINPEEINRIVDSYDSAKNNLVLRLCPVERNEKALENCVWQEVADLALVPRLKFKLVSTEGTMTIPRQLLEKWDIPEEQLWKDVFDHARKNEPVVMTRMFQFITQKMGIPVEAFGRPEEELGNDTLTIATNTYACGGAAVICYPGFDEEAREKMNGDYLILPSSVHEVILINNDQMSISALAEMVKSVNETDVLPEDRLSDHVYKFIDGELTIVD